jgi:hypothetical protein
MRRGFHYRAQRAPVGRGATYFGTLLALLRVVLVLWGFEIASGVDWCRLVFVFCFRTGRRLAANPPPFGCVYKSMRADAKMDQAHKGMWRNWPTRET